MTFASQVRLTAELQVAKHTSALAQETWGMPRLWACPAPQPVVTVGELIRSVIPGKQYGLVSGVK